MLVLRPRDGSIEPDPVDVGAYFSSDDIARARRFGRPQLALQASAGLVRAAVLVGFVLRGGPRARSRQARGGPREAAAIGAGMSLAVGVAPLPLRALARRRALAAGLATQSWGGWARDLAMSELLGVTLNTAAAAATAALVRRYPRGWWLPASGVAVAGSGALAFLGPVALDPLFNRFTPLPPGPLRDEVIALAARAGVRVGEVYEVDASRRTTAANAYVSGLGATKRVVLFDTLLRELTPAEIELVLAHELAHVRYRDVPRGLAHLALSAPAGMYAAAQLTRSVQAGAPDSASALATLVLSLGLVSTIVGGFAAALSRRVEARADAFALALADAPEPFISFERRLVRQNLADPDPPRWLVTLLGTHPPAVQRIGIARAYQHGARPEGGPEHVTASGGV